MKQIFDKNTLLVYLLNELSDDMNYEVETILTPDGCWTGKVKISEKTKFENRPLTNVLDYYIQLGEQSQYIKRKERKQNGTNKNGNN